MVALVADVEETERREPDFDLLRQLIDEGCRAKGLLTRDGRPSYALLGQAIKRSSAVIYGIVNDRNWPRYETLTDLADYFRQPRSTWLVAGGFAPTALPPTVERLKADMRRELRALPPDQREQVIRELSDLSDQL